MMCTSENKISIALIRAANNEYARYPEYADDELVKYEDMKTKISIESGVYGFAKELCTAEELERLKRRRFIFLLINPSAALQKIKILKPSLYEIMPPDVPVKLFFDIDDHQISANVFDIVQNKVLHFYPHLGKPIPYIVLSACSPTVESYHVIYPTIIFTNILHLKSFVFPL